MKQIILLATFLFTCQLVQAQWGNGIEGQGPVVKKELNVKNFTGVELNFSGNITLKQGSFNVIAEGQKNVIDNIKLEVKNGIWKVDFKKNVKKANKLHVYITMPDLTAAHINGSGNMKSDGTFTDLGEVSAGISGSGNLVLSIEASAVDSRISGSGNVILKGSADELGVGISGSGNCDAKSLEVDNCSVRISGSGNANVYVHDELDARISGSGDVTYKGDPNLRSSTSGSGKIRSN